MKFSPWGVIREISTKSDSIAAIEDGYLMVTTRQDFDGFDDSEESWDEYVSRWEDELFAVVENCGIESVPEADDEFLIWKLPKVEKIFPDYYKGKSICEE